MEDHNPAEELPLSTEKAERTAAEASAATIRMIPTACNESLVEREAIARIVDPEAWMSNVYCQHDIKPFRQQAFAKAEDIQALFSPALAERDEFSALLIAERNVAKDFRRQRDEARKELVAALDILNSFGKCDDDPQFTQVRDRLTSLAERCGREDTVDSFNSATRRPADGGDTEIQHSAGLVDAVSQAVSLADIAVTYDSIGRQYTHVTNADEVASAIISIVASRSPATGFAALAEEFAKPQFMTTTSGPGSCPGTMKYSLEFTFIDAVGSEFEGEARQARDALHEAIRVAAHAVRSSEAQSLSQDGKGPVRALSAQDEMAVLTKKLNATRMQVHVFISDRDAAVARQRELEEALRPFAVLSERMDASAPHIPDDLMTAGVRQGDYRRAARALLPNPTHGGGNA